MAWGLAVAMAAPVVAVGLRARLRVRPRLTRGRGPRRVPAGAAPGRSAGVVGRMAGAARPAGAGGRRGSGRFGPARRRRTTRHRGRPARHGRARLPAGRRVLARRPSRRCGGLRGRRGAPPADRGLGVAAAASASSRPARRELGRLGLVRDHAGGPCCRAGDPWAAHGRVDLQLGQAFVAGALLHVVFHQGRRDHAHDDQHGAHDHGPAGGGRRAGWSGPPGRCLRPTVAAASFSTSFRDSTGCASSTGWTPQERPPLPSWRALQDRIVSADPPEPPA